MFDLILDFTGLVEPGVNAFDRKRVLTTVDAAAAHISRPGDHGEDEFRFRSEEGDFIARVGYLEPGGQTRLARTLQGSFAAVMATNTEAP